MLSVAFPLAFFISRALAMLVSKFTLPTPVPIMTKYGLTIAYPGSLGHLLKLQSCDEALVWIVYGGATGITIYLIYLLRKAKN